MKQVWTSLSQKIYLEYGYRAWLYCLRPTVRVILVLYRQKGWAIKLLRKKYFITKQHDIKDCGPACIVSICRYYGLRISLAEVRDLAKTDLEGSNFFGLSTAAKSLGLNAIALQGTFEDLDDSLENGDFSLPVIANIVTPESLLHYIVIFEFNKHVLYGDPATGNVTSMSFEEFKKQWTGNILVLDPGPSFKKEDRRPSFLEFVKPLLYANRAVLLGALVCSLLITLSGVATAFVFQFIIDGIVYQTTLVSDSGILQNLILICVAIAGLYVLIMVTQIIRGILFTRFANRLDESIMLGFYNHTLGLPMSFFQTRTTGEILSRFSDSAKIREALSSSTLSIVIDGAMVVVALLIMLDISPTLSLVALFVGAAFVLIVAVYLKRITEVNRDLMEKNAVLTSYFKETVDGVETIKAYTRESATKTTTRHKLTTVLKSAYKQNVMYNNQGALVGLFGGLGTILVLGIGMLQVIPGSVTLGELITFNALLGYFLAPIGRLARVQPVIQAARVAYDRLNDVLLVKPEELTGGVAEVSLKQDIQMDNVSFRYGNRRIILENLSFRIPFGKRVAIVGESGSGKTTIAKLLLSFFDPEEGCIRIGDYAIGDISKEHLRKQVAYLSQEVFLFNDTVRNNITFGALSDIPEEELLSVCKACLVDDFVRNLPAGYDTQVDENGSNLSTGQKQRIALARALVRKPDIMILDEATSNLDTITERGIQDVIDALRGEITVIVIAHRLSTIVNSDMIFVLDKGRIVESGTHDYLLNKDSTYAKFWKLQ